MAFHQVLQERGRRDMKQYIGPDQRQQSQADLSSTDKDIRVKLKAKDYICSCIHSSSVFSVLMLKVKKLNIKTLQFIKAGK